MNVKLKKKIFCVSSPTVRKGLTRNFTLGLLTRLFLCLILLTNPIIAFETDQYNLPPTPLADIGAEVSDYTEENLRKAVGKINAEIVIRQNCLQNRAENCKSAEKERAKLAYLRSEDAVAREVYKLLGAGTIPYTKSGTWMNSHEFKAQPARYKTGYGNSIFRLFAINYLTISATEGLNPAAQGELIRVPMPAMTEERRKELTKVDGVYSADPKKDPLATRYTSITFDEVIGKNLEVMDATAFALCRDQKLPIKIFSIFKLGALKRVVMGEDEGTLVHV